MDKSVVLVTGTSKGIGREAVAHLRRAGAFVVATARHLDDIQDLEVPGEVAVLALDVTVAEQREQVVRRVLEEHGRIDALVNNAGYGFNLPVEETPGAAMQAMFDVNVFALHALTRLILPGMRERGSGRIVNVSSIAGHVSVPMMGAYSASKFAVRALTQALHNEIRPFGLHASLIEPGVIRTNFGTRAQAETTKARGADQAGPYEALHVRWNRKRGMGGGVHPRVIARRIVHACLAQRPRFHYFAPLHAKLANLANRLLPDAVLNVGFRTWFRMGRRPGR